MRWIFFSLLAADLYWSSKSFGYSAISAKKICLSTQNYVHTNIPSIYKHIRITQVFFCFANNVVLDSVLHVVQYILDINLSRLNKPIFSLHMDTEHIARNFTSFVSWSLGDKWLLSYSSSLISYYQFGMFW